MEYLVLDCDEECSFKLADGRVIRNLSKLNESLADMSEEVFRHHVNDERNDFANWARNVLKDQKLAEMLLKTKDKVETQVSVLKRILELINEMT